VRQLSLFVGGMSCVREVTARLRDVLGVETVSANPDDCVVRLSGSMQLEDVLAAFAGTSYRARLGGSQAATEAGQHSTRQCHDRGAPADHGWPVTTQGHAMSRTPSTAEIPSGPRLGHPRRRCSPRRLALYGAAAPAAGPTGGGMALSVEADRRARWAGAAGAGSWPPMQARVLWALMRLGISTAPNLAASSAIEGVTDVNVGLTTESSASPPNHPHHDLRSNPGGYPGRLTGARLPGLSQHEPAGPHVSVERRPLAALADGNFRERRFRCRRRDGQNGPVCRPPPGATDPPPNRGGPSRSGVGRRAQSGARPAHRMDSERTDPTHSLLASDHHRNPGSST
jgi:hypothetical protein